MRLSSSATVDQMLRVVFGSLAKDGYVYFVQAAIESGPVKIGYSSAPRLRINSLRSENAMHLNVLGMFRGNVSDEQRLHRAFANDHLHHEWFRPSARLLNLASRGNVSWDELLDGNQPMISLRIIRDGRDVLVVDASRQQDVYFRAGSAAAAQEFMMIANRTPRDSVVRYASLMEASSALEGLA